ncbi:MAG TPA: hypothetical protein VIV35_08240 [Chitinophagaceae bacterium]
MMRHKVFLLISIIIISCNSKKALQEKKSNFAIAKFDTTISGNGVYQEMEKQKEIYNMFEMDSTLKRTSAVDYCIKHPEMDTMSCSKDYNCRSYIGKGDTLYIFIGVSNGFSAYGFQVLYKNPGFTVKSFYSDDSGSDYRANPSFEIIDQNLVLSKRQYGVGDSIYGRINFKIVENSNGETWQHSGQGYFRSKVDSAKFLR